METSLCITILLVACGLHQSIAGNAATYPSIISASLPGLLGKLSYDETLKLLEKHYFTGTKNDSIWPIAIEETKETLGLAYTERQLFDMQQAVKNVYRTILNCDSKKNEHKKAKCFMGLVEVIIDAGFPFSFPRESDRDQARQLLMNVAFNVMAINALQMAKKVAEETKLNDLKISKSILDIGEGMYSNIKPITMNTIQWRVDEVEEPNVCQIQMVLWREFPIDCQTRSKRDVESQLGIGGSSDPLERMFRAKVIDNVNGNEVANVAGSASSASKKDDVIKKLVDGCNKKRGPYAEDLKKKMSSFFNSRTLAVHNQVTTLWNKGKKLENLKGQKTASQ